MSEIEFDLTGQAYVEAYEAFRKNWIGDRPTLLQSMEAKLKVLLCSDFYYFPLYKADLTPKLDNNQSEKSAQRENYVLKILSYNFNFK